MLQNPFALILAEHYFQMSPVDHGKPLPEHSTAFKRYGGVSERDQVLDAILDQRNF